MPGEEAPDPRDPLDLAAAVLDGIDLPDLIEPAAAVVGLGLGAAVVVLSTATTPPGYADAELDKLRQNYLYPQQSSRSVRVSDHRFALLEDGQAPTEVDFADNGLVAVVAGGVVIRTGTARGHVYVSLTVLSEPPETVESSWDEVVDVSWHALRGAAAVIGAETDDEYQVDEQHYELVVWAAPPQAPVVHRRTDRLGHRLRGEPEPIRALPSEVDSRFRAKPARRSCRGCHPVASHSFRASAGNRCTTPARGESPIRTLGSKESVATAMPDVVQKWTISTRGSVELE